MCRPERLDDMRADGLLLRELQLPQSAVADVVVRDIAARVVQEPTDAVLWHASGAALAGVRSPQGVVRGDAELREVVVSRSIMVGSAPYSRSGRFFTSADIRFIMSA